MARHWLPRKGRPSEAPDGGFATLPETAQISDNTESEAESEAESEREEVPAGPERVKAPAGAPPPGERPDGPGTGDRLAPAGRRTTAGLAAGAAARLPAVRDWLLPRLARLVLAVAGGLLLCASFPPLGWWWAAVVATALLGWVLTHRATTPAGGLGYGFLFGLALYVPLLPWISNLVGALPWLALSTTCALFPAVFGLSAAVARGLPGWPIWFAVLWGAQEWLKSAVPFGGFPWGSVAFGQAQGPLLPLVQLGGVALLSTATVLAGFSVTALAREIVVWARRDRSPEATDAERQPPAVLLPGVCICLVLLAAIIVWPQVRHAGAGAGGEPSVTVAAVQGNVPRLGLDFNAQRRAVLDYHIRETLHLAEDVRAGVAPQPQFVIWPEDSSDIDPIANPDAAEGIAQAAAAIGAPILIGTVLDVPGRPPQKAEYTNTVIVWNPATGPADRHDKEIVQPFGEYLPMPWLFKHLSGYADRAGHMVPGTGSGVVHIAGVPVGVSTCWEVIFDRAPRKAVLNGAQLLAVPSNNATFNQAMSEQQLAFAQVRAVEHDRYVVVAGTTGISAVIAPDGAELVRTDFFQPAYLDIQVRLKTNLTPATRWAPILQWVLVAAAGAVILAGMRHNEWFPRAIRFRSRPGDDAEDAGEPRADKAAEEASHDTAPDGAGDGSPPGEHVETMHDTPVGEGGHTKDGRDRGAT
jgi:apolipoprotein N-acyltransferase